MANIAATILHNDLVETHSNFIKTLDGVTEEIAHFQPEGKANPIAGTYAHLVFSEDFFMQMLVQGKAPLMEAEFNDKTGASEVQPSEWENAYPKWLREVKVDMEQFATYRDAVFKASEEYLATLTDEDLEKEVDMSSFGMSTRKLGSFINGIIIGHAASIMGEVSVLKGIQGLKGYPF